MCANHTTVDLTIPSDLGEARTLQTRIEEALVNAIKHGNQLDPDKYVEVSFQVTCERFDIRIVDEGPGFNPEDVPDPTAIENIERPCGRGLLLIRGFMDEVKYHGRGNIVTMIKLRNVNPEE